VAEGACAKGWLVVDWPVEHGGPGFTPSQRYIFGMEMAAAGAPPTIPFGPRMCAPVIMKFGSEEQKARHLPPHAKRRPLVVPRLFGAGRRI
jgi:alkylation response protein AidB-like acyl-CoA dehydrogenase